MGFYVSPNGHDSNSAANLDSLSQLYISLATIWTLVLAAGIAFLLSNRDLPILRVRKVYLASGSVCALHVYWALCMFTYTMNGKAPCQAQFWIMSIYFPFGIALFQMCNAVLQHTVDVQQRIVRDEFSLFPKPSSTGWNPRQIWSGWKRLDLLQRISYGIAGGMLVQTIVTVFLFFMSRRFHGSWGVWGSPATVEQCLKGWEWWPSIAWQLIWTWIYAPYTIWSLRGVHDMHGWRLQTVICSLASMPGAPMWLIALYSPAFSAINLYWYPSLWFVPGMFVMETCLIFIPCWHVVRTRKLRNETLHILAEWEKVNTSTLYSSASESTYAVSTTTFGGKRPTKPETYNMQALEKTLAENPTPLLVFAARKEFTGENVSYLMHIRRWKEMWAGFESTSAKEADQNDHNEEYLRIRRRQFNLAVEIYIAFVSLKYSAFPINVPFDIFKELEKLFQSPASLLCTQSDENTVVPFERNSSNVELHQISDKSDTALVLTPSIASGMSGQTTAQFDLVNDQSLRLFNIANRLPDDIQIPEAFDPMVFDKSVKNIQYLVYTNTWPKFVSASSEA